MATTVDRSLSPGEIREICLELKYTDLVAASTAESESFGSALPANAVILGHRIDVVTAFAAPVLSAIALIVGDSSDDNAVIASVEIMSGVSAGTSLQKPGTRAAGADDGATLIAALTATGANFGDGTTTTMTAGEVHIHVLYALGGDLAAL